MPTVTIEENNGVITTKGFKNIGLPEIKITLSISINLAKTIINEIRRRKVDLKEGYNTKLLTCPIYLKKENDFMKIIFPDPKMNFPWDNDCMEEYKKQ